MLLAANKQVGVSSTRIRPIEEISFPTKQKSWSWIGFPLNRWNLSQDIRGSYKFAGIQYTESEGHPFLSSKKKGVTDLGGEFFTQKRFCTGIGKTRVSYTIPGVSQLDYHGPVAAIDPKVTPYPDNAYSNDVVLDALGAEAISLVKPTNPVAGLTQALVEIRREGLPHLAGSQTWESGVKAANAADDYLNVEFGWSPLINDITDFAGGVTHARQVIDQYKRGIGRPTRRSYDFPTVRESSETVINANARPFTTGSTAMITGSGSRAGVLYRHREVVRRRWFSGCFTYFFPEKILGSIKLSEMAIQAHQLGLEATPETVWNIAPWSWAVDWFSNTGDVISNWTAFHEHGLVMYYGYMMERSICTDTYSLVGSLLEGGLAFPVADVSMVTETKVRRQANPYGFGVSWDGLSSFQSSILAAIGISRSR